MLIHDKLKQLDAKEFELPETVFIQNVETRVFQSIVVRVLAQVEGIALLEGNLIDSWLGRDGSDIVKGVHVEQDEKGRSLSIRVEVNVAYNISIPQKAEEVQTKIAHEITRLTGLHVGVVHLVFKNLIPVQNMGEKRSESSREELL